MDKKSPSLCQFLELPDFLTLLGGMFGLLGAMAAISQYFTLAAMLLLFSVPCDYFDGKIARAVGRQHQEFGKALDTIVDAASFGIAPVIFGYCLGLDTAPYLVILLVFAGAAVLLLARFTVLPSDPAAFSGMPVTYNNLIFPGAYFLFQALPLAGLRPVCLAVLYLAAAFLMASTIRWKKF